MKSLSYQLIAAITFFTRIPAWKLVDIPVVHYRKIICFWPFTGWITGAVTAGTWLVFSQYFPAVMAVLFAVSARILLIGALHEDGLGDFLDGFGGGKTKADSLRIMKDSHTGSFALTGMILYFMILVSCLTVIPPKLLSVVFLVADPFSKFLSTILMNILPYSRNVDESKSKTLYDKLSLGRMLLSAFFGFFPMILFFKKFLWLSATIPVVILIVITILSNRKIGGYTGDVCGATALLCELGMYIGICFITLNFSCLLI